MADIKVTSDPKNVGLSAERLMKLDDLLKTYVDDGLLPGWLVAVARRGEVVHLSTYGHADVEAGKPVKTDTIFRIYSMTKPLTSVATMMLWEDGVIEIGRAHV